MCIIVYMYYQEFTGGGYNKLTNLHRFILN